MWLERFWNYWFGPYGFFADADDVALLLMILCFFIGIMIGSIL